MRTIATHNGIFHSDEVLAIALLKVFTEVEYTVTRTRNPKILAEADIRVDVGGKCQLNNFATSLKGDLDHHQFDKDDELFGLSSAGLVWKALNTEIFNDVVESEEDFGNYHFSTKRVVNDYTNITRLVSEVDEQDVGTKRQEPNHLCNAISSFNGSDIGVANDTNFELALVFTAQILRNMKRIEDDKAHQLGVVENATIQEIDEVKFAISTEWVPAFLLIGKADFLVSFDKVQLCYTVQQVPIEACKFGGKFEITTSGHPGEVFVHKAGFIGKYKELDGAIILAIEDDIMKIALYGNEKNVLKIKG